MGLGSGRQHFRRVADHPVVTTFGPSRDWYPLIHRCFRRLRAVFSSPSGDSAKTYLTAVATNDLILAPLRAGKDAAA